MKATELISELQQLVETYGDNDVQVHTYDVSSVKGMFVTDNIGSVRQDMVDGMDTFVVELKQQ